MEETERGGDVRGEGETAGDMREGEISVQIKQNKMEKDMKKRRQIHIKQSVKCCSGRGGGGLELQRSLLTIHEMIYVFL